MVPSNKIQTSETRRRRRLAEGSRTPRHIWIAISPTCSSMLGCFPTASESNTCEHRRDDWQHLLERKDGLPTSSSHHCTGVGLSALMHACVSPARWHRQAHRPTATSDKPCKRLAFSGRGNLSSRLHTRPPSYNTRRAHSCQRSSNRRLDRHFAGMLLHMQLLAHHLRIKIQTCVDNGSETH